MTFQEIKEKDLSCYTREQEKAIEFIIAKEGIFNGFDFCETFHSMISKAGARLTVESDDKGNACGVHVGADGVTVYFFCDPKNAKKQVRFNRSVYVF